MVRFVEECVEKKACAERSSLSEAFCQERGGCSGVWKSEREGTLHSQILKAKLMKKYKASWFGVSAKVLNNVN